MIKVKVLRYFVITSELVDNFYDSMILYHIDISCQTNTTLLRINRIMRSKE